MQHVHVVDCVVCFFLHVSCPSWWMSLFAMEAIKRPRRVFSIAWISLVTACKIKKSELINILSFHLREMLLHWSRKCIRRSRKKKPRFVAFITVLQIDFPSSWNMYIGVVNVYQQQQQQQHTHTHTKVAAIRILYIDFPNICLYL